VHVRALNLGVIVSYSSGPDIVKASRGEHRLNLDASCIGHLMLGFYFVLYELMQPPWGMEKLLEHGNGGLPYPRQIA
jgi:hypothetical protein